MKSCFFGSLVGGTVQSVHVYGDNVTKMFSQQGSVVHNDWSSQEVFKGFALPMVLWTW